MSLETTVMHAGNRHIRTQSWAYLYDWRVDRASRTPLFRQIYLQIRSAILSRTLPSGTKLPSTRELAHRLHLARASVVSAYEQLLTEGYLSGKVGSGTYISSDLPEPIEKRPSNRAARQPAVACPRLSRRAKSLEKAIAFSTESDQLPFVGRCSVDARTVETWRMLTHRAARSLGPTHLGHADAQGTLELRTAICDYLRAARAVRCNPEHIIVTAGSQQAIDIAIRVLLDPGDRAWVEDPCYPPTYDALIASDVKVCPIPVDAHGIDVSAGLKSAPTARAAFVTPSNQFPSGVVLSMPRRMELLAWAREADAWIIEDDFDSEYRYSGRPLASLQGLDDSERTIYVGTLNKVLFPGLRIGYAVVPQPLLDAFVKTRALIDRHPPTLYQTVAAEFMRQGHLASHIRRMRLLYRDLRDALVGQLAHHAAANVFIEAPNHGMNVIGYLNDGLLDIDIERATRQRGIIVRSISRLYRKARPKSGLMLGFTGFSHEAIVAAAARLAGIINEHSIPNQK